MQQIRIQTEPTNLYFNTWAELKVYCPIELDRISYYAQQFRAFVNVRISSANINKAKRSLLEARAQLDLMLTTLNQLLYNREILKTKVDEVLMLWLMDNLGRLLKDLDKKEQDLLVDYDNPDPDKSRIGISRLSAYAKSLKIIYNSVIFETLLKSTKEYWSFKEETNLSREPRTFLYIMFHILHITIFSLGSISRLGSSGGQPAKKDTASFYPSSWEGMMKGTGQKKIAETYKSQTGEDISDSIPPELFDNGTSEQVESFEETYTEEVEDE